MKDSLTTRGRSCERFGRMMAGLLLVAEFSVVRAARRFSRHSSLSIVTNMGMRLARRTLSRSQSGSVTAKRKAAIAAARSDSDFSRRQDCFQHERVHQYH